MIIYFFLFLCLLAGAFCGMAVTLQILARCNNSKQPATRNNAKKQRKHTLPPAGAAEPVSGAPLTRKIPPKDFSSTEFNCAADGMDPDAQIAARQQQQDDAYNTLRRRGQE